MAKDLGSVEPLMKSDSDSKRTTNESSVALVRPAKHEDLLQLALNMRPEDIAEVRAAANHSPFEALAAGFRESLECWSVDLDGEILFVFGLAEMPRYPEVGIVWALGSPRLPVIRDQFLRQSIEFLDRWNERFPILTNYIDARNTLHIKWLKRSGFVFLQRIPGFGHEARPFYEFVRYKEPCAKQQPC